LALQDVDKEYDMRPVLDGVNVCLEAGCSYLLTAENGSGKTTLLQVMAGLIRPTRGRVLWRGKPVTRAAKAELGVVLQPPMIYGDLTGLENLTLYAGLFGVRSPKAVAEQWLDRFQLCDFMHRPAREYSKGMRQRLALARALVHGPTLLLLDEPFDGLDVQGIALVQNMLREVVVSGGTVFMVAHQLQPVERVDRHFTLCYGKLVDVS
jgi:ABC-type multidrug transport system ATPase subunit